MNAKRLFALYERIADAPDAIARLRRFILDLAVRGKLAPQDANDEPASTLLERILRERERLAKAGYIRGRRGDRAEIGEAPFSLPATWIWVAFGEVHELVRGVTYSKSDVSEEFSEGYVPILRANNISNRLTHDEPVFVKRHCVSDAQFLRAGDFMIALSSGSKNLVGKAAFVPEDYQEAFGGFCGVIRLIDHNLQGMVRIYLQGDLYRASIAAGSRGIGINNLKKETLSTLCFPLPPLAEQHRIVVKVDELMALCDRLEAARAEREKTRDRVTAASLARLNAPDPETFTGHARFALDNLATLTTRPDQIKQLRQTILNLAVRGKLVPQDPNDEPASVLFERILKNRTRIGRERPIRGDSIPPTPPFEALPSGWSASALGQITIVTDPNPSHRYPDYANGTVPILSTQEFHGVSGWNTSTAKLTTEAFCEFQREHCAFAQGDIVFARKGRLGMPRFLPAIPKFTFSHTIFVIKPMPGVLPTYLLWLLRRDETIAWLTNEMNQNTGVPTLGKAKTERLPVPLPPETEQHRIVAKVDELMALCDQLEASLATGDKTRGRLLDALLAEALEPSATASRREAAE